VSRYVATVFDLDGTLCRHEQDIRAVFDGAFADAGVERFAEPDDLWPHLGDPTEYDDERAHLADGFAALAAARDRTVDADALAAAFVDRLDWSAVAFLDGAETALAAARANGPVGLLTNGPERRQSTKLAALGLTEAFDAVVFAGDMERRKPHRDPFDRALGALETPPERTLYVGNSLEYDVGGARAAGWPVAWVRAGDAPDDPGEHAPDHVLRSVGDLADVYR
jgi:putative hydrolase of the HAD superfamily